MCEVFVVVIKGIFTRWVSALKWIGQLPNLFKTFNLDGMVDLVKSTPGRVFLGIWSDRARDLISLAWFIGVCSTILGVVLAYPESLFLFDALVIWVVLFIPLVIDALYALLLTWLYTKLTNDGSKNIFTAAFWVTVLMSIVFVRGLFSAFRSMFTGAFLWGLFLLIFYVVHVVMCAFLFVALSHAEPVSAGDVAEGSAVVDTSSQVDSISES